KPRGMLSRAGHQVAHGPEAGSNQFSLKKKPALDEHHTLGSAGIVLDRNRLTDRSKGGDQLAVGNFDLGNLGNRGGLSLGPFLALLRRRNRPVTSPGGA